MVETSSLFVAIICTSTSRAVAAATAMYRDGVSIWRVEYKKWTEWNHELRTFDKVQSRIPTTSVALAIHHTSDAFDTHFPSSVAVAKYAKFNAAGTPEFLEGDCVFPRFPDAANCPITDDDRDELLAWAVGARQEMPSIHRRQPVADSLLLPALAILCQGYLAVQRAVEISDQEQPTASTSNTMDKDAATGLAFSQCGLDLEQLVGGGPRYVETLRDIVISPEFWAVLAPDNVINEQVRSDLLTLARKEWGDTDKNSGNLDLVEKLLLRIGEKMTSAKIVNDAYTELVKRLEAPHES